MFKAELLELESLEITGKILGFLAPFSTVKSQIMIFTTAFQTIILIEWHTRYRNEINLLQIEERNFTREKPFSIKKN